MAANARSAARRATLAVAHRACLEAADLHLSLGAKNRGFKVDGQVEAQIVAALLAPGPRSPARSAAHRKHFAKQIAKDIAKIHAAGEWSGSKPLCAQTGVAVAIVSRTLVGVAQHLVGFAGFLELLFGRVVPG